MGTTPITDAVRRIELAALGTARDASDSDAQSTRRDDMNTRFEQAREQTRRELDKVIRQLQIRMYGRGEALRVVKIDGSVLSVRKNSVSMIAPPLKQYETNDGPTIAQALRRLAAGSDVSVATVATVGALTASVGAGAATSTAG